MSQRTGIDTGLKFFGYRILLEAPKDPVLAGAIKRVFIKDYQKSGPLEVNDPDVQICLKANQE